MIHYLFIQAFELGTSLLCLEPESPPAPTASYSRLAHSVVIGASRHLTELSRVEDARARGHFGACAARTPFKSVTFVWPVLGWPYAYVDVITPSGRCSLRKLMCVAIPSAQPKSIQADSDDTSTTSMGPKKEYPA